MNIREVCIKDSGGEWLPCEQETVYDYAEIFPHAKGAFVCNEFIPESGIIKIKNGIVTGHGISCTEDYRFILEGTWFGKASERSEYYNNWLKIKAPHFISSKHLKVTGSCLNLSSIWSNVSSCHFILDTLGKISILEKIGISFDNYDYVCVNSSNYSIYKEFVEKFAQKTSAKLIGLNNTINYQFDRVDTVSLNGKSRIYRVNAFNSLISLFDLKNPTPYRKLYISRENSGRDIHNKNEIEEYLLQNGFELVNVSKTENYKEIFNEASIVVGAHGAGLANCAFCQKNTTLIEFTPEYHQYPYYMSLAHAQKMYYYNIICPEADYPQKNRDKKSKRQDFFLPLSQLETIFKLTGISNNN